MNQSVDVRTFLQILKKYEGMRDLIILYCDETDKTEIDYLLNDIITTYDYIVNQEKYE